MFLHAGASLHGHEYSTNRQTQAPQGALPFLRSALRRRSDADKTTRPLSADVTSLPQLRPMSYHEKLPPATTVTPVRRTSRPRPKSEYMPRRDLSVRFREPETDDDLPPSEVQSEDEGSAACSDISELSDSSTAPRRRRRKRTFRKSTQFLLAHPAPRPGARQRRLVHLRPRLLLQLQEVGEKRPIPAFDVVPSSLITGSQIVPRMAKRCPHLFRTKPVLGMNDLLIVRSEDYDTPASPGSLDTEDSLDQRDVVAVISPLPQMGDESAEIVMEDGSTWESSLMANGSYEFIGVDERGRISTARWVKKTSTPTSPMPKNTGEQTPPPSPLPAEVKWTFSMIHPDTRRHPIMGSLMSNTLDVFDTYNTMSTSSGRYPPTRNTPLDSKLASDWIVSNPPEIQSRLTKVVPEDIKLLMVATASWVNLRQSGLPASGICRTPSTLQKRTLSNGGGPQRAQTFPARPSLPLVNPSHQLPHVNTSPASSSLDSCTSDMPARRRSVSYNAGFVKRFVTPRVSEDGRPPLETLDIKSDRPPTRRVSISVRNFADKIFRRRSNSHAQAEDIYGHRFEY
ncbi:hypothetical protein FOCG_02765 [Fusarium oxysporum f. sp. radicis-lycopersici 26381]|uniref:Uncharacterized protein n=5 Tax=Fusarium oxysporum TaxID=5507 RepID=A0A420SD42_FUSOX|nr:uncharacterized protein FOBCDRAFT_29396 [Fusarium oxysporum Fo47]EXA00895.1 hypothetical protein FOWG_00965 [Fusarium oxysporum f. sp. lycopersici MN25]EXL59578.1 hypothetical protein FOCG_02765 [Fusarium oxysporum f. sp. radicis-lycopersici 26381]KAF5268584.1 hypothetical protein FOXYS1_516 [Fusarium oxysporum]PCD43870.1 hypothetical protein AU210_002958 [Fusarium oxysporum f. sp. radicis-cucumerinum]RKK18135.1 hypothetical protein BFJ65_g8451 [Fusarium oxysporum f. sp. cepae]RYC82943.1 h